MSGTTSRLSRLDDDGRLHDLAGDGTSAHAGFGEIDSLGPVVTARVEIAEPPRQAGQDFLDLLTAAARGDVVSLPVLLRRLIPVPEELAHLVRLPVAALLAAYRPSDR